MRRGRSLAFGEGDFVTVSMLRSRRPDSRSKSRESHSGNASRVDSRVLLNQIVGYSFSPNPGVKFTPLEIFKDNRTDQAKRLKELDRGTLD